MSHSTNLSSSLQRPRVWLVGEHGHDDFCDAVALLRADAELSLAADPRVCPELIVAAQSRPGVVDGRTMERLRHAAPLARVVALLGSWCEGQARASRPIHDMLRLYWYEFASWWPRQLAIRGAGRCPDWTRPGSLDSPPMSPSIQCSVPSTPNAACRGVIALNTPSWDIADALGNVLERAGYATLWHPPGRWAPTVRGVTAGIWEDGQLDDREAADLAAFCRRMAAASAPVVALLDFPRRDRGALARQMGAATVLGKPWHNTDLVATIERLAGDRTIFRAA